MLPVYRELAAAEEHGDTYMVPHPVSFSPSALSLPHEPSEPAHILL